MKASGLRWLIKVQRATETLNEARTPEEVWADIATLRAEKVEQSASEFIRNYGPGSETLVVFRTHFLTGITTADRILFEGQPYNLKEIVIIGTSRGCEFRCVRLS